MRKSVSAKTSASELFLVCFAVFSFIWPLLTQSIWVNMYARSRPLSFIYQV